MKLYVFGITPFAEMLRYYVDHSSDSVFGGYIVDEEYMPHDRKLGGADVLCWDEFRNSVSQSSCEILSSVTYGKMNSLRESVFYRVKNAGYKFATYVHPTAHISDNCSMGEGNIVLENVTIQPFVSLNDNNVIWSNACICHHTHIGSFNFFAAGTVILGQVNIGDKCFFGANSTVSNMSSISSCSLVGAGCFASTDTKNGDVVVPSRATVLDKKSCDIRIR